MAQRVILISALAFVATSSFAQGGYTRGTMADKPMAAQSDSARAMLKQVLSGSVTQLERFFQDTTDLGTWRTQLDSLARVLPMVTSNGFMGNAHMTEETNIVRSTLVDNDFNPIVQFVLTYPYRSLPAKAIHFSIVGPKDIPPIEDRPPPIAPPGDGIQTIPNR